MQDSKENAWSTDFDKDVELEDGATQEEQHTESATGADVDGWQQYRRWISKAPAPNKRRGGVDPSLYTWKGYRNWTEQVKRNWSDS